MWLWRKFSKHEQEDEEDEQEDEFFYTPESEAEQREIIVVSHAQDYAETYEAGIIFLCVDSDAECAKAYNYEAKRKTDANGLRIHMKLSYGLLLDFDRPDSIAPLRWRCTQLINILYAQHAAACREAHRERTVKENMLALPGGTYMFVDRAEQQNRHMADDPRYFLYKRGDGNDVWLFDMEKDELGRATLLGMLAASPEHGKDVPPIAAHLKWVYLLSRTTRYLPSRIGVEVADDGIDQWSNPQMATRAKVKEPNQFFFEDPFPATNLATMPEVAIRCMNRTCWPHNLYQATALSAFVDSNPGLPYEGWIFTSGKAQILNMFSRMQIELVANSPGELMMMAAHAKDERVSDIVNWGKERSETVGKRRIDWGRE